MGSPRFLGNLRIRALLIDSGRPRHQAIAMPQVLLSALSTTSALQRSRFRSSITQPASPLSTLHVLGYPRPRKTRFRPVASLSRAGLKPARFQ